MYAMLTERYTATFFGLEGQYHTEKYITSLWSNSANKEYMKSNVFVTARITSDFVVSDKIDNITLGDVVYVIVSVRSPSSNANSEEYWNAYKNVINDIRAILNSPYMTISKEIIDYYYFLNVQ